MYSFLLALVFLLPIGDVSNSVTTIHAAGPGASCHKRSCASPIFGGQVATPELRPPIDTWNNAHLFLTFDSLLSNPAAVANRYDFVWGADVHHLSALHAGNPDIILSYYMPFHRDYGTFLSSGVYRDLTYWKTNHPDWILYRCDRVTPAYEFGEGRMPFDFSNPALVPWQIQTYALPASQNGYDAIAADNLDLGNWYHACGIYRNGKWVQLYTGKANDPHWFADVVSWLTQMQTALHNLAHPMTLIPNLALSGLLPTYPQVQQLLSHLDSVLDEGGFTQYGSGYLTGNDWVQTIKFMENVQQQKKAYYSINQFSGVGRAQIQWALASYLMGKEHSAALYISTIQGYGNQSWFNEYTAQIGSPTDAMYFAQNVYWRDYSGGLSIVNPSATNTFTVTLSAGQNHKDLYGNSVSATIELAPHTGMVLLSQ